MLVILSAAKNLAFEDRDCPCEVRCFAFGSA